MTREDHKTRLVELAWDMMVGKHIGASEYQSAIASINALAKPPSNFKLQLNHESGDVQIYPVEANNA